MLGKEPLMKCPRELVKTVKLQDDYLSVTDEKAEIEIHLKRADHT